MEKARNRYREGIDERATVMGGCCYTPRRTQFLWWYWLLLASIVGIPMLLACLYVARHHTGDEKSQEVVGPRAAVIFWAGCGTVAILMWIVGGWVMGATAPVGGRALFWLTDDRAWNFSILIFGYLGGLIAFTSIKAQETLVRLLAAIAAYGLYIAVVFQPPSLAELFWLPAVCAGTAHFVTRFTSRPTPKTARWALLAVVAGAFLFWGVMKYGRWLNFALHNAVQGHYSTALQVDVDLGD
jgi:hypothetical protein